MNRWSAVFAARRQRELFSTRGRMALWWAGLVLIPLWQLASYSARDSLDTAYSNDASIGAIWKQHFFFLYHLGLFPVRCTAEIRSADKGEAERILREEGPALDTNANVDRLQAYLHFVDVWMGADPRAPGLRRSNGAFLTLGLLALFSACIWCRLEILGLLVTALAGSNPYYLYEAYVANNVFCWPLIVALTTMALCVFLMGARKPPLKYVLALTVALGLILGLARHIRGECLPMAAAAALVLATLPGLRWWARLALPTLCAVVTVTSMGSLNTYFAHKQAEACEAVARAGGKALEVQPAFHPHWHPIWCGLGDFDGRYGYIWDDRVAYEYSASEVLKNPRPYDAILKEKIWSDIKRDPGWFLGILGKRVWRILAQNTPLRLGFGGLWFDLPIPGAAIPFLLLLLVAGLLHARNWEWLKFLLFSAPLAFTPLLVYSGHGLHQYSALHLFIVAVFLALLLESVLVFLKRPEASPTASESSAPRNEPAPTAGPEGSVSNA